MRRCDDIRRGSGGNEGLELNNPVRSVRKTGAEKSSEVVRYAADVIS